MNIPQLEVGELAAPVTAPVAPTAPVAAPVAGASVPGFPTADDMMKHALALLEEKQPTKKRVEWTALELAQLNAFLSAAKLKGISLNTMNTNFKEMISPIFPGKSRSAFWAKSGELKRNMKISSLQPQQQQA